MLGDIRTYWTRSAGCNACPNRDDVVEIKIGQLLVRLCNPCIVTMLEQFHYLGVKL